MAQSFLANPSTTSTEASPCCPLRQPEIPHREPLKHLLIGSPKTVRGAIHALHVLGYAEVGAWSPLIPTTNEGEVMSILVRQVWVRE
ncbi:hypothetical protein IQ249_12685 [Lusitaniella coriacea LEGE 07157]|uniref:Uncharacterized protein n=2 Tax=Lusitaniella TaxID=1983104 RepID=A0A8J7DZS8_9CYAN|nr:hypothetical protein [Lusitaniella coriacea LEGE 07157]